MIADENHGYAVEVGHYFLDQELCQGVCCC